MKLKTIMRIDGKFTAAIGDDEDMSHDAACAHALMLAIEKVLSNYPESVFPENGKSIDCQSASMARFTCRAIKAHAREIFSEWGFGSGEDE